MRLFLGIDVTKHRNFIIGIEFRGEPDEIIPSVLIQEGEVFLGIYLEEQKQYSLEEIQILERKMQKYLRKHNLSGIASVGESNYRLVFVKE